MSEVGTDGGSCDATMMLVPLWRISRHDLDESCNEIRAADVLVGFVEDDEFVE